MPLDPSLAGRSFARSEPYEVARAKIREFAEAIGDPAPAYRDPAAAQALGHPDVIAPPTFPTVLALRAAREVVEDLSVEFARVVHGDERYAYARPVRAGDVLTIALTVESVRAVAGNDLLVLRGEIATTGGEPVVTTRSTLVVRGEG